MFKNSKEAKHIHKLLKRTIVSPEAFYKWSNNEPEELSKTLAPLNNYITHHAPSKLYKMRTASDMAFDALEKDKLYLTRADYFNDPYDCFLTFDIEKLKSLILRNLSDEKMSHFIANSGIPLPIGDDFPTVDAILKVFRSKRAEFLEKCASILPDVTVELQKNTYVASLTENIISPVMWAHYANNHKGFAIEYQFRTDMFSPHPIITPDKGLTWHGWKSILPVYYSKNRLDGSSLAEWFALCKWWNTLCVDKKIDCDMSNYLPDLLLKTKLCLQKSMEWAYEREWRLTIANNWPNHIGAESAHIFYPPTGIYLGERISSQNSMRLKEIAQEKNIPVYQMYIDHSGKEYKMEVHI